MNAGTETGSGVVPIPERTPIRSREIVVKKGEYEFTLLFVFDRHYHVVEMSNGVYRIYGPEDRWIATVFPSALPEVNMVMSLKRE